MESFPVTLRQAIPGDEKHLLEFTKAEGWDYSDFDVKSILSIDPDFLIVAVDCLNTPVGFCGLCDTGSNTLYFDVYVVREDLRCKGIGRMIWNAMLERAGKRNVCLDSVPGKVEWYRRQGFVHDSFKLHVYSTIITSDMRHSVQSPYNVQQLSESTWPFLLEYDKQVYLNLDREKSLRAWYRNATTVLAFLGENVVGYGCIHKKYEDAYRLRNVFGDNKLVVETMLQYLTANLPDGSEICFYLIEGKPLPRCLKKNCKFNGMAQRMFNQVIVEVNLEKIWLLSGNKI